MERVRLGLIGLGNIGAFHADYLRRGAVTRCELTAVCDSSPARRAAFADLATFATSEELIRSGLVDAVLVATPSFLHTAVGCDALQNGLHVLIEKPLATQKADAEKLLAAQQPGLVAGCMLNQRTEARYKKARQMIQAGELGALQRVLWVATDWFRTETYYASGGWRATWRGEGGGVLMNQSPHQLDLLQWLCGMPTRVWASCGLGKRHRIEVEDEVTAYLEFPGGATGVFITSTGEAPGMNRLEICGDRGLLTVEREGLRFLRNETGVAEFSRNSADAFAMPDLWRIDIPTPDSVPGHAQVTQNFVAAILDGTPLIAPLADGMRTVELANAMLYAHFQGTTVNLPLDAEAYRNHLEGLIAGSTLQREVREQGPVDITKSFRKTG